VMVRGGVWARQGMAVAKTSASGKYRRNASIPPFSGPSVAEEMLK
jgi:hypothetical protein